MEYFEAEQDNIGLQSKRKAEAVRKKAESVQEFNRIGRQYGFRFYVG